MIFVVLVNILIILWVVFLTISGASLALLAAHLIGMFLGNLFGYLIFEAFLSC